MALKRPGNISSILPVLLGDSTMIRMGANINVLFIESDVSELDKYFAAKEKPPFRAVQ